MRQRLGLPNLPRGTPIVTCFCGAPLASTDSEHAHSCPIPNALRVLRHDNIVEVVRRALCRGGVASSKEPVLEALHRAARQAHAVRMHRPTDLRRQTGSPAIGLADSTSRDGVEAPAVEEQPAGVPAAAQPPVGEPSVERPPAVATILESPPQVDSTHAEPSVAAPPAEEPPLEAPSAVQAAAAAPLTEPAGRAKARGDVLFELNGSLQVGDVSVIHPGASSFRRAAANSAGAAAAHRDEQKRRQYRRQGST
jgi:hypothetical protein